MRNIAAVNFSFSSFSVGLGEDVVWNAVAIFERIFSNSILVLSSTSDDSVFQELWRLDGALARFINLME